MFKKLLIIGFAGIAVSNAGGLYNDNYMKRSGIVHETVDTGIPNRVNGSKLLHWNGYVIRLAPIVFNGKECSSSLDYLGQLLDNNRNRIKYISVIGHSSSIVDDENRMELRPWANMWHSLAGKHEMEKSKAVQTVNDRIRYVYDYIKAHGISTNRIYNENRLDREPAYTEASNVGRSLNNRVNVAIYSYAPLSIADLDIHFALDSDLIEHGYDAKVEKFAQLMKDNPNMRVTVVGHTDRRGGYGYNINLSKRRAEVVKRRLIELGIERGRISTKGVGYTQPVARGNSERAHRMNRRIEAKLYL